MNNPLFLFIVSAFCLGFALFRPRKFAAEPALPAVKGDAGAWLLLLVSIAGLYVELLLIRWIGTEVRIFAFVQNLVLIACFLGFGVGCFQSSKPGSLVPGLDTLVLLALIISLPALKWQIMLLELSNLLTLSPDAALWGSGGNYTASEFILVALLAVIMVAVMLWLIAETIVPLGRWVGYCFDHSKNTVRTYSINLAGSLIGTWLLVGLSVFNLPPTWWLVLAFGLILLATPKSKVNWMTGALLLVPILILVQVGLKDVYWSPYQKLAVSPMDEPEAGYFVKVNNVGYMTMANVTQAYLKKHASFAAHYHDSGYDSPFRFVKKGANVLIVGAGAGNDAAAAVRNGAAHVDAVEIDPMIYQIGKTMHPDHPYDNPKVNVVVNDARNFLRRSADKYDAIIFGLLDSHTEVSGYTNMRVDNYVYTKQSFEQASHLLKPDGVLILKFEVREPWTWIGQRFYRTLTEVFGRTPVTFSVDPVGSLWSGTTFIESRGDKLWKDAEGTAQKTFIKEHPPKFVLDAATAPQPATDDWPYPYNRDHTIPRTYLTVSAILLFIAFFMVRKNLVLREKQTWTMFLLGAGFMLMETQLVCRLTLYFGTTWIVNSIAVSTVLAVLVLANVFIETRKKPVDRRPFFVLLIASILVNYCIPWEDLPYTPWVTGMLLSGAFAVSVLMAGIIFTTTLQKSDKKSGALGANVMGAVAGGLSQNLSFIIGLKALLPVAALCYAGAAFFADARKK